MNITHTLNQLTLKPASSPQVIESRKNSFEEWGKWLSLEQYLQRDEEAEAFDHANEGKLTTWVLVPADNPETLNFFCACETYRRDIWVLPKNEMKTISDIGYGVASVFTPKKYRGKGYATHMMSLLHFVIANPGGIPLFPSGWGSKPVAVERPGIVSILYSDVGCFYGRCSPGEGTGWTITSPVTTEWVIDENEVISYPDKIELLSRDEAARTAAADATLFKRDLESKGPSPRIHFAFQPTEAWCRFQMTRYDEHPLYVPSLPTTWGVRMKFQGETHFIVWEYEASPERKLTIISTRATRETFSDLFTAVKYVCQTEKHLKIEAWGLGKELSSIAQSSGGRTYERSKSLPAMKWYGEPDQAIWFGNHKLDWC